MLGVCFVLVGSLFEKHPSAAGWNSNSALQLIAVNNKCQKSNCSGLVLPGTNFGAA